MRFLPLLFFLYLLLPALGQHFVEVEELVVSCQVGEAKRQIDVLLTGDLSFEEEVELLRLKGDALALEGRWEAASMVYDRAVKLIENHSNEIHWNTLRFILLTRLAYWDIHPDEAVLLADSALHYVNRCDDELIVKHRLFQAWNVAAQATKQKSTLRFFDDYLEPFGKVDSLCLLSIRFIEAQELPAFYLSEAIHIHGNSFTDRVHATYVTDTELKRYFKAANECYTREIDWLTQHYGPDHGRIFQAQFTTYMVHTYAQRPFNEVDSLGQRVFAAYFPEGHEDDIFDPQNALMFLRIVSKHLFSNSEEFTKDEVLRRFELYSSKAWFCWQLIHVGNTTIDENRTLALYNLSPAVIEMTAEIWRYDKGAKFNIDRLFELNQYLKSYDGFSFENAAPEQGLIHLSDLQLMISEDQVFLEFIQHIDGQIYLMAIEHDTVAVKPMLPDFFKKGELLLEQIMKRDDSFRALASELFDHLEERVDLRNKNHITVSCGHLTKHFPFEVLLLSPPADGSKYSSYDYLGKHFKVNYLLSPSMHKRVPNEVEFVVAGYAPEYDEAMNLPFSRAFMREMSKKHPTWTSLEEKGLNEILEMEVPIIHLAMHGQKRFDRPSETVLQSPDVQLTVDELGQMQIKAAFAVINACHSGEGRYKGTYGIESPARSVLESGVKGVISNLWAVDDRSSSALFSYFYEELISGQQSDQALSLAKRRFIQNARSDNEAHPFYWAAAVHYGGVIVVQTPDRMGWSWMIFVFVFLCAGGCIFTAAKKSIKIRCSLRDKGDVLTWVERLKNNPSESLGELYKSHRNEFIQMSLRHYNASIEAAKDAFQEALLAFYRNAVEGKIHAESSTIKTYLFQIGRNKLIDEHRKSRRETDLLDSHTINTRTDDEHQENLEDNREQLHRAIGQLKDDCKSLIELYYIRGYDMDSVARELGLKNANSAKSKKVECMKCLVRLMNELSQSKKP